NRAADARSRADPAVAVASIMYPEVFLAGLGDLGVRPEAAWVLPDHAAPGGDEVRGMAEAAGARGVVGTLKDVVKLRDALPDGVPLWCAREEPVWEAGREGLTARLADLTGASAVPGPGPSAAGAASGGAAGGRGRGDTGDTRKGTRR
ncbi:MAG: tetraacyldisaccharide 4'-kinase, partial [Gemmatimonadota bacterium]